VEVKLKRQTVTQWLEKFGCCINGRARAEYVRRAKSLERDPVTGRLTVASNERDPRKTKKKK
jgi:hypothetical protein